MLVVLILGVIIRVFANIIIIIIMIIIILIYRYHGDGDGHATGLDITTGNTVTRITSS